MRRLNFYSDPAHGWLEVPLRLIMELGIDGDISACSYRACTVAYLEEDGDAGLFIEAACRAAQIPPDRFDELYSVSYTEVGYHDARNPRNFPGWWAE